MSIALTRNFSAGVSGNSVEAMHTGFSAYMLLSPACSAFGKTGRYDLAWKDLCSVLNALSK